MSSSSSSCGTSQLFIRGCELTEQVHSPASALENSSACDCGTRRHLLHDSHCTQASLSRRRGPLFFLPVPWPRPCCRARRMFGPLSSAMIISSPASVLGCPWGAYSLHLAAPRSSSGVSRDSSSRALRSSSSSSTFFFSSSIRLLTPFVSFLVWSSLASTSFPSRPMDLPSPPLYSAALSVSTLQWR